MKAILSIVLFISYWFIIAIFIGVFAGYIMAEATATNLGMFLAIPLGFIATRKTINKIFKNKKQPEENQEKKEVEEKKEKEPEYSHIKPKEESKKPSERYLEKLQQQGKSPTQEADKIEKEKIKQKVMENIQKFREETYGETKSDNQEKEIGSFELMPGLEVKITSGVRKKNLNKEEKKEIENIDIVLPYTLEIDGEPVMKIIHKNEVPRKFTELIKMLWEEGFIFNPNKWELTKFEEERIKKRLFQVPLPSGRDILYLIDKIRGEEYTQFLSEEYLKNIEKYKLAKAIKDITVQFYNEERSEEEYLEVINTTLPIDKIQYDPDLSKYLGDMVKVISPTKRQRIKGLDRVEHYWKYVIYSIQSTEIGKEISLLTTNESIHNKYTSAVFESDVDFADGFRIEPAYGSKPFFFDLGYGENALPKTLYPIAINSNHLFFIDYLYSL